MENESHSGNAAVGFSPPQNLLTALSEIQHYFLFEKRGQQFDPEYFTMNHVMGYMNVAVRSAWWDSVIFVAVFLFGSTVIYFMQGTYITDSATQIFVWTVTGSVFYWFAKIASFSGLVFSTILCTWMSRYYIGVVPRKAINTLFGTRLVLLMSLSLLLYFGLGTLSGILSDRVISQITGILAGTNQIAAAKVYSFLHDYFRRALFESAILSIVAGTFSGLLPFAAIGVFRIMKRRKRYLGVE